MVEPCLPTQIKKNGDKMVSTMNVINEIVNGNKIVILRDPVPKGAIGISLVFGDEDKRYNGLLDIRKNKDLLILLAEAMEDEEE